MSNLFVQQFYWTQFRAAGFLLALGVLSCLATGVVAQDVADDKPAASAPEVPASIADIPGISPGSTPAEWSAVAQRAVDSGQWRIAQRILREVVILQPNNVSAASAMAFAYERQAAEKRADTTDPTAVQVADQLIDEAVRAYLFAAPRALAQGEVRLAERMYKQILMYRENEPQALMNYARLLKTTQRGVAAIEHYKKYVRTPTGEHDAQAYLELGELYRVSGFPKQAISALLSAKSIDPERAAIHAELALTYLDDRQHDESVAAAEEAVRRDPRNASYQYYLAGILLTQKEFPRAAEATQRAIELAREALAEEPFHRATLTALSSYYARYEVILGEILSRDADNITARLDVAKAIAEHADVSRLLSYQQALATLLAAPESDRNNISWIEALAEMQVNALRYEDALATCQRLLKINANNAVAKQLMEKIPPEYRDKVPDPAATSSR